MAGYTNYGLSAGSHHFYLYISFSSFYFLECWNHFRHSIIFMMRRRVWRRWCCLVLLGVCQNAPDDQRELTAALSNCQEFATHRHTRDNNGLFLLLHTTDSIYLANYLLIRVIRVCTDDFKKNSRMIRVDYSKYQTKILDYSSSVSLMTRAQLSAWWLGDPAN